MAEPSDVAMELAGRVVGIVLQAAQADTVPSDLTRMVAIEIEYEALKVATEIMVQRQRLSQSEGEVQSSVESAGVNLIADAQAQDRLMRQAMGKLTTEERAVVLRRRNQG